MLSILMLDTNVKSCQFMSWQLSLHFSYCQLRCPLCGDFPLVSNIASSGVHMCCHRHYFFNKNLDSSSTPKNSDSGFCLFFRLKCTPELTIWETRGKLPQSAHLSWQYEKLGDNRHDMTWHDLTWIVMTWHGVSWLDRTTHVHTWADNMRNEGIIAMTWIDMTWHLYPTSVQTTCI